MCQYKPKMISVGPNYGPGFRNAPLLDNGPGSPTWRRYMDQGAYLLQRSMEKLERLKKREKEGLEKYKYILNK